MIKDLFISLYLYCICLILIALYSLVIYVGAHKFFAHNASGSLIIDNNKQIRGSILMLQTSDSDAYFSGRNTSKINIHCDVSLYNEDLKKSLIQKYNDMGGVPDVSLITPSSSLLDPYITKRDAMIQASKIATYRGINVDIITDMIDRYSLNKIDPFFQLEIVNTTLLNSILDGY